jgi:mono/diheme cytochrome c family protein
VTPTPSSTEDSLVAKGEEVFQKTAGGVGCQACHGRDAKGGIGPNIRGATVSRISFALSTVEQMSFINLSPEEVQAVAAYLQTLE